MFRCSRPWVLEPKKLGGGVAFLIKPVALEQGKNRVTSQETLCGHPTTSVSTKPLAGETTAHLW